MKHACLSIITVFVLFTHTGRLIAAEPDPSSQPADFIEKKVFLSKPSTDTIALLESVAANPDMTHVAYVAAKENMMQVVVNNKPGKFYDHIAKGYPVIADHGNKVGYIADKDSKHYVVIDGTEYPGYDGACDLIFSPNGKHFAYIAQEGGRQFVVQDGQPQKKYEAIDRVTGVIFSGCSRHIAYVARNDDGSVILISDKQESPPYVAINRVVFSPDGNHLACLATRQKEYFTLRDGKELGPYDMVDSPTWSPNSRHLAFIAIQNGKWLIINDDQIFPAGDYDIFVQRMTIKTPWYFEGQPDEHRIQPRLPQTLPPKFSPDSSRLIWSVNQDGKYRMAVDSKDQVGPLFDAISEPVFSPDSKRFAYIGKIQNEYMNKEVMVIDGELSQTYDIVGKPVFSPDSQHLAYRAMKDGKWCIVRDGRDLPPYDAVLDPIFSNNSKHIVYAAARDKLKFVIFDDQPSDPYKYISQIFFSPQGNHWVYIAGIPTSQYAMEYFIVGDGHKGQLRFISHIGLVAGQFNNIPANGITFITPAQARTIIHFLEDNRIVGYQLDIHFISKDTPHE